MFKPTCFKQRNKVEHVEERVVLLYGDSAAFLKRNNRWELPTVGEIGAVNRIQIGDFSGVECSAGELASANELPPELELLPIRQTILNLDALSATAVLRSKALLFWRKNRKFCGACGNELKDSEQEPARICPHCNSVYYPVISPAVIVAIDDGNDRLLLAHNRKFRNDMHSLIAGFVEAGECLEDAVRREIAEEIGISVKNIRYFGSQSWPYPGSLMVGFQATYDSGSIHPDGEEITHADFFRRNEIPEIPSPGSIARTLIDQWLNKGIVSHG